jgi:serine/threonine-protein kinase
VKVIDFGIAAPASATLLEVFGSPGHMPPEQVEGKTLTPATDVFAVAVLLLEAWSGKAPFRRKEAKESEAALHGPRPKPSEADPRLAPLDEIVESALALDPLTRPQDADELGRALRKFTAGVDLHDVARSLGDLVRELRARPSAAKIGPRPGLQRPPSRPSAATVRTRTFAARDEVNAVKETPPDTIATRPLETVRREEPEGKRSRAWWVVGALAAVTAVALFFAVRGLGEVRATPEAKAMTSGAVQSGAVSPPASPPSTTTTAATLTSTVTPTATTLATASTTTTAPATTTTTAVATTTASSARAVEKARLTLIGDTGTLVAVDGASKGACPTQVQLDPGSHSVSFRFPATGESLQQSVALKPGDKVSVRADFTGATPSVKVWR